MYSQTGRMVISLIVKYNTVQTVCFEITMTEQ